MLVLRELVEEVFFGEALPVFLLGAEVCGNVERGHNGGVVYGIGLDLVEYFACGFQGFGHIGENLLHLLGTFQPFLLGIVHSRIVEALLHRHADEAVVCLGVVFIHEMHVIGCHYLYVMLLGELKEHLVHLLLLRINFVVSVGLVGLVALEFEIIVVSEHFFEPDNTLFGQREVAGEDVLRHFAAKTCRADYQPFVVLFQLPAVGARLVIHPFGPCF